MNNLMIDLESMGKKPNAPIVSIGAVFSIRKAVNWVRSFTAPLTLKALWSRERCQMVTLFCGG